MAAPAQVESDTSKTFEKGNFGEDEAEDFFITNNLLAQKQNFSNFSDEDWKKSLLEFHVYAYQKENNLPSKAAAAAQLKTKSAYQGPDSYPKWLQKFMNSIMAPALKRLDTEYREIWKHAKKNGIQITYTKAKSIEEISEEIKPQLKEYFSKHKTGAALLFQGTSWTSKMIRALGNGRFSHVALYLPKIGHYEEPCLWQSGEEGPTKAPYDPSGKPVENRDARIGPDLHSLCDALAFYIKEYPDARFILRDVVQELDEEVVKKHIDELLVKKLEYPNPIILVLTYVCKVLAPRFSVFVDWYYGDMDKYAKGFFCSQLVANAYHHTGVLDHKIKPAEAYGPSDFGVLLDPKAKLMYLLGTETPLLGEEKEIEFVAL